MAIDTVDKRASTLMVGLPFRAILPEPDGVIAAAERIIVAFRYSGILTAGVTITSLLMPYAVLEEADNPYAELEDL